ncbi:AGE family epimerase/isomerase [Umezawaea beigongshangensis]|uniref:AGE family epimerase/isomerase n=1 Tax=Umezawaea beigongshangensis TaxID=2780383 RepID=UPI0018F156DE|nr:AGE family epimerase/isomerase [Umezawaea beigongshangensis]
MNPSSLASEALPLVDFARASRHPGGGFGWLDERGALRAGEPVATWITARMTHVFALADGLDVPGSAELVDHGVAALRGPLHDDEHGGWFASTADTAKTCYEHAFVVLAASSAVAAGRPHAADLLTEALAVVDRRFWDDDAGLALESWDRAWTTTEPYRGANSNMHLVEALLAAGDVTGDPGWHRRALRVAETLVHGVAAAHDWRLPEHFAPDWTPLLDHNRDRPDHPFRPYGTTVGHWLEWSRLLLHLEASLGRHAPDWLLPDARRLFDAALTRGWHADGHDGFVYTLDWQDRPVVRSRMHWVIAEAVLAAAALTARTGDEDCARAHTRFCEYALAHHVDREHGSWHHELTPEGLPSATVWSGKPDVYHAFQAALLPLLPLAPVAAVSVRTSGSARAAVRGAEPSRV